MKDIDVELKNIVSEIRNVDGVLAVYVFGSYVKGNSHGLSDVDICVIGNISSENKTEILLKKNLEVFDISFFEGLPIWMKFRVFREGKCLFVKNECTLNLVKLAVLKEYLEFKPVIDNIINKELGVNVR